MPCSRKHETHNHKIIIMIIYWWSLRWWPYLVSSMVWSSSARLMYVRCSLYDALMELNRGLESKTRKYSRNWYVSCRATCNQHQRFFFAFSFVLFCFVLQIQCLVVQWTISQLLSIFFLFRFVVGDRQSALIHYWSNGCTDWSWVSDFWNYIMYIIIIE